MDIINTELTDGERKIILDSFFGGKDDVTLAKEAGISPSLYNYRKKRALNKIRAIYNKRS